jgi:hypothetical protein
MWIFLSRNRLENCVTIQCFRRRHLRVRHDSHMLSFIGFRSGSSTDAVAWPGWKHYIDSDILFNSFSVMRFNCKFHYQTRQKLRKKTHLYALECPLSTSINAFSSRKCLWTTFSIQGGRKQRKHVDYTSKLHILNAYKRVVPHLLFTQEGCHFLIYLKY